MTDLEKQISDTAQIVKGLKSKLVTAYKRTFSTYVTTEDAVSALGFGSNWNRFHTVFALAKTRTPGSVDERKASLKALRDNGFLAAKQGGTQLSILKTSSPDLVEAYRSALDRLEQLVDPAPVVPCVGVQPNDVAVSPRHQQFRPVDGSLAILRRHSGPMPLPSWDDFLAEKVPETQIDATVQSALKQCGAVTVVGKPSCGKTMLALRVAAAFMRDGGEVVYVDLGEDPVRRDLKDELDGHLLAHRHIIIDNCHRDTQLAEALRERFKKIINDGNTTASLLMLGTQTNTANLATLAEPEQPIVLKGEDSSLSAIARFVLKGDYNFTEEDIGLWNKEFAGNLNAFALAVDQSRSNLKTGQTNLSKRNAIDWHRTNSLTPDGHPLGLKEKANLACLAKFADQRLELAVTRDALPYPSTGLMSLLRTGVVNARKGARNESEPKFVLTEPGWGSMILTALDESPEFDLQELTNDALREPMMALALWRRFRARNDHGLARDLAEQVFSNSHLIDRITKNDPHYLLWWLYDVTQPYDDQRDAWRKTLLDSHFGFMQDRGLSQTHYDAVTLRRMIDIVSRQQDIDHRSALASLLCRSENQQWFVKGLDQWQFGVAVDLAKTRDTFCVDPGTRWKDLAFKHLESDPNAIIEAILISVARPLGELLEIPRRAKNQWGEGSPQLAAVNGAIANASPLFPARFAKEPITVVSRALHAIEPHVRRDLFRDVSVADIEQAPTRGKLYGAAWVIKACNEAGNSKAAARLAQLALETRDPLVFASPNMMLFEISYAANISDIGQSDKEILETAEHVRAILSPEQLDKIFSNEALDPVALADGLLPISTWRYPLAPELVFRPSLDKRITDFFEQLSWHDHQLHRLDWYRLQAANRPNHAIRRKDFRISQIVRLLGCYSLLFDIHDANFTVNFQVPLEHLTSVDGVRHRQDAVSVQRHQMQSWFGLRAIASATSRAISADISLLEQTRSLWQANADFAERQGRSSDFRAEIMIAWLRKCIAERAIVPDDQDIRWHYRTNNQT
jgi:hypothetical protein